MINFFKGPRLYLIIALVFLILIVFTLSIFPAKKQEGIPEVKPSPSSPITLNNLPSEIKPILTEDIPFKPSAEGGGVNLNSSLVQESQREVTKVLPLLPYGSEFQTPGGTVSILIPSAQYQETPWVLDIQVFGINYQAIETDPDYNLQKDNFLKAVAEIFRWMKESNINPEKIIINWGDKAFIRERAEKWLSQ